MSSNKSGRTDELQALKFIESMLIVVLVLCAPTCVTAWIITLTSA